MRLCFSRLGVSILPFRKAYFASFGSMKGCVVVDDRTNIGSVYDGISTDPTKYPTTVPNFTPHSGLLNGIKFK